jgi:ferredoxin
MNAVIYLSPANATKKVAEYFAIKLDFPLINLTSYRKRINYDYSLMYNYVIFCFPVYSQNIPSVVIEILKSLKTKNIVIIATYGRMSMGNVLYDAKKLINANLIGAAYVPTKHTYKAGSYFSDLEKLDLLIEKIKSQDKASVIIPKLSKNIFANFFPNLRSRLAVKLKKTNYCLDCGFCSYVCPTRSISYERINHKTCIRCLACYVNCPYKGVSLKYSPFLKMYLKKDKKDELIIYM